MGERRSRPRALVLRGDDFTVESRPIFTHQNNFNPGCIQEELTSRRFLPFLQHCV